MNSKMAKTPYNTNNFNILKEDINKNRNFSNFQKNSYNSDFPNNFKGNTNSSTNFDFDSHFREIKNSFSGNENRNQDFDNVDSSSSQLPNFDMNSLFKIKSIMDKVNSTKNSPRTNLLLSLKPYLKESRKEKLDQYITLFNMAQIFENFNSNNGGENK